MTANPPSTTRKPIMGTDQTPVKHAAVMEGGFGGSMGREAYPFSWKETDAN